MLSQPDITTMTKPGFAHRTEICSTGGGIQLEGQLARRWESSDRAEASMGPAEIVTGIAGLAPEVILGYRDRPRPHASSESWQPARDRGLRWAGVVCF